MASVQDASVTSASAVLRERCWPAHERLEAHPLAWLLLSDKLTPKSYARVLSRWYQAWQPLEALVLAQAPAQVPQAYRPAPRAHLAAQDLAYLGHELPPQHGLLAPLPPVAGTAWYGVAYVMQGSALGAQVIAAHLHRLLGLQAGLGASFFAVAHSAPASDGGRRSPRLDWATWQQWLDSQLGYDPDTVDEAAQAANATFDYLHNAFSSDAPSGA